MTSLTNARPDSARLAADALAMQPADGIPSWMMHVMDIGFMEEATGYPHGAYERNPDEVYVAFQRLAGTCMIDQYLATNPLSMEEGGYEHGTARGATTGAERIVLDGMAIDSPEDVVAHLERFVFPRMRETIDAAVTLPEAARLQEVAAILEREQAIQAVLGDTMLKVPYGDDFNYLPALRYGTYGYANYLMAYAVYPEVMEQDFILQADLAACRNRLAARAIVEHDLPKVIRLDHDMADSRGTLMDVRTLDQLWFPHFQRAVQPYLDAGIRLIWHCDGNLSQMVPRLIEAGIGGFQGFQYEDGMDYEHICRLCCRGGEPLMIWAGVSVTRTLPFGTPDDVKRELAWLVEAGPRVGLFLGASSSITPGVRHDNLRMLMEGLRYFQQHGRKGLRV